MAADIIKMKGSDGKVQYPVTSSEAVGMSDGSGNLDKTLATLDDIHRLNEIGISSNKYLNWITEDVSNATEIDGLYKTDGTIGFLERGFKTKILNGVNFGEIYMIDINYESFFKNVSILAYWKDENIISHGFTTDTIATFKNTIIINIPIGINKISVHGSNIKKVTKIETYTDLIQTNKLLLGSLNIEINDITKYANIYQDWGISNLGKITHSSSWKLNVVKVKSNTKYYIKNDKNIYGATTIGALGYSSEYPTIKDNEQQSYVDMSTLKFEGEYKVFQTDEFTNYILFNSEPLNNTLAWYVSETQNDKYNPFNSTTEVERFLLNEIPKLSILDIRIENIAKYGDVFEKGIGYLGSIVNSSWKLNVVKVKSNTKYYIKNDKNIYGATTIGALGYSSEYPTITDGKTFDYVDMNTLSDEDSFKVFQTNESTNYILFNNEPLSTTYDWYISENKDLYGKSSVTTAGEREIYKILQEFNQFEDKVICILGDSITALGNNDGLKGWVTYFKKVLKFKEVRIYARSGATWSCTQNTTYDIEENTGSLSDNNVIYNQMNRLINDVENNGMLPPDYIISFAGTNDAWYPDSRPDALNDTAKEIFVDQISSNYLDDVNINTCTSIAKAIRYVSEMIISKFPKCKVMIGSPLQSSTIPIDRIESVSQIIEQCANYMSYAFINQSKDCSISRLQERKGFYKTTDGTHTSEIGAKDVGEVVAARFKSFFG